MGTVARVSRIEQMIHDSDRLLRFKAQRFSVGLGSGR